MKPKRNQLSELLHRQCVWGECPCAKKYYHLGEMLRDRPPLNEDELEDLRVSILTMLACIAAHCSNTSVRQQALMDLLSPEFSDVHGRGRYG